MPGRATAPATSTTRTAPPADGADDVGTSLETRSPAGSAIGGRGLIIAKNTTATIAPSPIAPAVTQASVLGRPTGDSAASGPRSSGGSAARRCASAAGSLVSSTRHDGRPGSTGDLPRRADPGRDDGVWSG